MRGVLEKLSIIIRQLELKDAAAYKALRLEALQEEPEAFLSSYEEEKDKPQTFWEQRVTKNPVFGAFSGDMLVGVVGYFVSGRPKNSHKGHVWGTYITPKFRDKGIAEKLMRELIRHAELHVESLLLGVATSNKAARKLYDKLGFEVYGIEKRAMHVEQTYYDEEFRELRL